MLGMSDFYTGFEGKPEIQFLLKNGDMLESRIRIWEGYFDALMTRIKPDAEGWTGLALPYNLHEGWYEAGPWRIPDTAEALAQWSGISTEGMDRRCVEVHGAVIGILAEARRRGRDVWIAYE
jgi:hypothetical protein